VLWNIISSLPYIAGAFASGYLVEHLTPSQTFILMAALTLLIALQGLWKSRAVFNDTYNLPQARGSDLFGDIKRLVKHRPFILPSSSCSCFSSHPDPILRCSSI